MADLNPKMAPDLSDCWEQEFLVEDVPVVDPQVVSYALLELAERLANGDLTREEYDVAVREVSPT